MRHVVLAAALGSLSAMVLTQEVLAQEAQNGQGMRLTVRPSGYDAQQNEAQARQEKLLKRLEQSDHMIRSICINCGDAWKHQIYAPFDPYASLKPSARPTE